MNRLRLKFGGWLDFIRRERLYFLLLVLALTIVAFSQSEDVSRQSIDSAALNQLESAAKNWDASDWILTFEKNPQALFAVGFLLLIFFGLFFVGMTFLLLAGFIPSFLDWFESSSKSMIGFNWKPVVFFRVLVLIFTAVMVSGVIIGNLWEPNSQNENLIGLVHTLIIDLFACISVLLVLRQEGMRVSTFFENAFVGAWQDFKRGLMGYAAAFPLFVVTLLGVLGVSAVFHYEPPTHPLVNIFLEEESRSQFVFQFALILAAIAAPILEEIFFRGFCYRLFKGWWGVPAGMGISAALFAGMHGSGFAFFPIFVLGLALAWLYEKRGNLTACWTFHILHNILFTSYFFTAKSLIGVS